eukprot:g18748.t1
MDDPLSKVVNRTCGLLFEPIQKWHKKIRADVAAAEREKAEIISGSAAGATTSGDRYHKMCPLSLLPVWLLPDNVGAFFAPEDDNLSHHDRGRVAVPPRVTPGGRSSSSLEELQLEEQRASVREFFEAVKGVDILKIDIGSFDCDLFEAIWRQLEARRKSWRPTVVVLQTNLVPPPFRHAVHYVKDKELPGMVANSYGSSTMTMVCSPSYQIHLCEDPDKLLPMRPTHWPAATTDFHFESSLSMRGG